MPSLSDIGMVLRTTRTDFGWSLQDVAHRTRIPVQTLHGLEENDYSNFPSPTYAKSFLAQYSEYLGVDAAEWLDAFETGDVFSNLDSYDYLKDHDEHLNEDPVVIAEQRIRKAKPHKQLHAATAAPRAVSGLQPLMVFTVTAALITGIVFGFMHFSEQFDSGSATASSGDQSPSATEEEDLQPVSSIPDSRPIVQDTTNIPRAIIVSAEPTTPSSSNLLPPPENPSIPRAVVVDDSPPPRAIIVDP